MMIKTRIRKHEVGLRFRYGDFERVLQPGLHWAPLNLVRPKRVRIEVHDRLETRFEHELLDVLVEDAGLRSELLIVELAEEERALVWKDERLAFVLGPGRHAFWQKPFRLEVERFNVRDVRFLHPKLEAVVGHLATVPHLETARICSYERGLLFLEGRLREALEPGLHAFWAQAGQIEVRTVDLREQVAEVSGQEIMTADKVTLRVNLLVTYRVTDAALAVTEVSDYRQAVYREAQLTLRASVGTRRLDQLLADKQSVGTEVRDALASRAGEFGVRVRSVGLRDLILPGEMKVILNQVIEAQKRAEANVIRTREETAAVRSQLNTARLMAENPTLARMKELEGLREILSGARTTFVFGSSDLSDQLRSLVSASEE